MRRKTKTLALCGVLAALATALLFFGGALPFAAVACPVLASLVLIPVYAETGWKWGLVWYLTVALLGLVLAPDKETAVLFVFFGYYPILRKWFGRLPNRLLQWAVKLIYVNAAGLAAYALMIFVFQMEALVQEYAKMRLYLLIGLLLLANISFVIYDLLIGRLEIYYHVRLRPKLNL